MTNVIMFMVDEMVTIYINDRELYKTVANGFLVCMLELFVSKVNILINTL